MPRVTVAIPTRNRVQYLALSLQSALRQTLTDIEVLVSDNRCTDGTADYLASVTDARLRILRQERDLTMVQNWNACVTAATGDYFLLLSDDDLLEPEALEKLLAAFSTGPQPQLTGFVYCRGHVIDAAGNVVRAGMRSPASEDAAPLILSFFNGQRETWPCSILFRREDMGLGYSAEYQVITDAAMWMKLVAARGRAAFVDEFLVNYRVHASLTGATPIATWQQENSTLAEYAIAVLQQAGRATLEDVAKIRRAVQRLNQRVVITLPLSSADTRRRTVLRQYFRHVSEFTSFAALRMWVHAVVVVALPKSFVQMVRREKRKLLASQERSH